MNKAIKQFLNNWKANAKKFYKEANKDIKAKESGLHHKEWVEAVKSLQAKYGKGVYRVAKYEVGRIDEILEKEAEKKEQKMIARIEKKAGEILDASEIEIADDGSLNGYVVGSKNNVQVQTIYAGGYNIQCVHFRTLVKVL